MTNAELDALIAEKVMGLTGVFRCCTERDCEFTDERDWTEHGEFYFCLSSGMPAEVPKYASSPDASKQLREKLAERWDYVRVDINRKDANPWARCSVWDAGVDLPRFAAHADTEELAICKVALLSVDIEVKHA